MADAGERGDGSVAEGLARALDRERDILQAIMDNSRAQVAYLDPQFRFVRVNSAYARACGHPKEDLLGRNHFELFPSAENQAIFEQVRDTGQAVEYRAKPFEYADQPERGVSYWDWALVPVKDETGQVQGLVLSLEDVTEHERAEQALREALELSEQRQAEVVALLSATQQVLRQHSFDDTVRSIFDTCKHLTGATAGYVALTSADGKENEVLFVDPGWHPCTVDPDLPMPIRGLRAEVYQTRTTVVDNDFRTSPWAELLPPGHLGVENVLFSPLVIGDEVVGLLGLADKRGGFGEEDARLTTAFAELAAIALHNSRLMESLEASELRFRSVVETANAAIVAADSRGRITFWNRMAERMFGFNADEMIGEPLARIMPERIQEHHVEAIQRVLTTGKTKLAGEAIESVGIRKGGHEFPLEISLATWKTAEGRFFTAVMRDVTRRKRFEEALREANQSLEALIKASPLAILAVDLQTKVSLWNPAAERIFGWREEEVLGRPNPLIPPGKEEEFQGFIAQTQAGRAVDGRETVRCTKDGRMIDVSLWTAPLYDAEGKLRNVMAVMADISERKQAELALHQYAHEQNALYTVASAVSSTLDQAELLPLVLDAVLPALEADAGWVLLPGPLPTDPPRVVAQRGTDEGILNTEPILPVEACPMYPRHLPVEGSPEVPCVVLNCPALAARTVASELHTLVCIPLCVRQSTLGVIKIGWRQPYDHLEQDQELLMAIGRQVGVALNNAQLYEEARQVNRLRVLSELDRALAATLELQTLAEVTLQHMARHLDAPASSLLLLPPAAEGGTEPRLLTLDRGWEEESADRQDAGRWQAIVDRARERGGPSPFAVAEAPEPGDRHENALAVPIWGEKALMAVLVLGGRRADRPFGDEDQALAQVASDHAGEAMQNAKLYQEVRRLLREQEKTRAALVQAEKLGALGRLAASVAHEINNPLQAVDSSLSLLKEELRDDRRPDKLDRYLQVAAGEVGRISAIVRRMRDYYRPAHERLQPTDLPGVLDSVLALSDKELQHRGVTVERAGSRELPLIQGNPDHLRQVFLNLILNAMDAMPGGGTLGVATSLAQMQPASGEPPQPAVRVDISDTGQGMAAEAEERLFEPFFTTKEQGTGLGLAISFQIIEAHNGQITVSSEAGVGTTFTTLIPVPAA